MEKIGIFGGSFNPIHCGHIEMANLAVKVLKLDKLYIVPVGTPCHRCDKIFASGSDRIKMIELAYKKNSKIYACDFEIVSKKTSYTYDTLIKIKEKHHSSIIYEIIGEDSAEYLHEWKNYEKMKKICKFVFFKREGYNSISDEIMTIKAPLFNISSTLIRRKIISEKSLKDLLTPDVEEYIKVKKLYR